MFLGNIFAKNAKNDPKTLLEASKYIDKIYNIYKSKYTIYQKDIDLTFCTHIHHPLPSNILYGFWKILILRGKILKKEKIVENFGNFRECSKFSKSEIAVL